MTGTGPRAQRAPHKQQLLLLCELWNTAFILCTPNLGSSSEVLLGTNEPKLVVSAIRHFLTGSEKGVEIGSIKGIPTSLNPPLIPLANVTPDSLGL